MSVARSLQHYLDDIGIQYRLVAHPYSEGSMETAMAAHIPRTQLAKAVLFRDEDFHYTLAVLPSSHKVKRHTINEIFDRHFEMASEEELDDLFPDCCHGAVPPIGQAYQVDVVWDQALLNNEQVFIEAGDHEHLICLEKNEFARLMADAMCDEFSTDKRYRPPPKTLDLGYSFLAE